MAMTISELEFFGLGNRRAAKFWVRFPDVDYTFGGETLTPGSLRMTKIDIALIECKRGMMFEYDYDNEKFMAIYPRGEVLPTLALEIPPGETTVKSVADSGEIISISGKAAVDAGAGSEVKAGVNLSEIEKIRCLFIGY